jgi:hypothetical protein
LSEVEKHKRPVVTVFALVATIVVVAGIGILITLPALTQLGIVALEGSAKYFATAIDIADETGNGIIVPTWFSSSSFMLQIYCDSSPDPPYHPCPQNLRNLHRQGKALLDSLNCTDSFCICLGTFNTSYENAIIQRQEMNVSNRVFYNNEYTSTPEKFLQDVYEWFFHDSDDSGKRILRINCVPIKDYLAVYDYSCANLGGCSKNIFTYMYANGTYSFSAMLEKSSGEGTEMRVMW